MNIIKKRRKELKITQIDIQETLGISRERIGKLENGELVMPVGDLKKICAFLEIEFELYYEVKGVKVSQKI